MKQFLLLPGAALLLMTAALPATAETVNISTPNTSLVLDAEKGGKLRILHYGNRLSDADIANLSDAGAIRRDAYPVYGIYPQAEAAMSVTHADGNRTTDTEVTGITSRKDADGADVTTIAMRDKVYPFDLNVNYRTYPGEDVIETWVDVKNNEKGTVTLNRFMSGYLPVRYGNVWLSQLYGSWANEGKVSETPLNHGVRMIKNKDGVRNSHTSHARSCSRLTASRKKTPAAPWARLLNIQATTNCLSTLMTATITTSSPASTRRIRNTISRRVKVS